METNELKYYYDRFITNGPEYNSLVKNYEEGPNKSLKIYLLNGDVFYYYPLLNYSELNHLK